MIVLLYMGESGNVSIFEISETIKIWKHFLRSEKIVETRDETIIVLGNEHGELSSNLERSCLPFLFSRTPLEKERIHFFSLQLCVHSRTHWAL